MKIPTVKHCCCGLFDLITAGKIAGIVPIVGAVLSILLGDLGLSELITIGVSAAFLYGIFKEKPYFMLPKIFVGAAAIVIVSLAIIYLLIFGKSGEVPRDDGGKVPEERLSPLGLILIMLLVVIPGIYFWIVEYSVYRFIKDEEKDKITVPHIPPKNEV